MNIVRLYDVMPFPQTSQVLKTCEVFRFEAMIANSPPGSRAVKFSSPHPRPLSEGEGETPSPSGRVGVGFWVELNSPASPEGNYNR